MVSHNKWKEGIFKNINRRTLKLKKIQMCKLKEHLLCVLGKFDLEQITYEVVWEDKDLSSRFLTVYSIPVIYVIIYIYYYLEIIISHKTKLAAHI